MISDIDAMGDVVIGGLAADAVSRPAGMHRASADIEHGLCLNCGAHLTGDYCHRCGQSSHIHRSMAAFGHDLLHGVLHFEGKTWRTLPMLAWRPGELTRRYIHGERAQFVSPMALFLFAVFLLFAIASYTIADPSLGKIPDTAAVAGEMNNQIAVEDARIAALQTKRDAPGRTVGERDVIERQIADARSTRDDIAGVLAKLPAGAGRTKTPESDTGKDLANGFVDGLTQGDIASDNWLSRKFGKARENPDLLFYKVKTNAYKFAWALIPLSLPFVWLVTIGPATFRHHLYDHMIFTTYSIAFMMLLTVVLVVAGLCGVSATWLAPIGLLYPPFHMYRQLKGTYRMSRAGALIRAGVLVGLAVCALIFFIMGLVALGVAT